MKFYTSISFIADQWEPADIARSLVKNVLEDVAGDVMGTCHRHGIKRVFFCGSLLNSSFMRDELMKCVALRWPYLLEVGVLNILVAFLTMSIIRYNNYQIAPLLLENIIILSHRLSLYTTMLVMLYFLLFPG